MPCPKPASWPVLLLGVLSWTLIAVFIAATAAVAAEGEQPKPIRAKPPVFPQPVVDLFSSDVPDYASVTKPRPPVAGSESPANLATNTPDAPVDKLAWSKLISASALEDEIKSYKPILSTDVGTLRSFKATGYTKCRRDLSQLAVLFGIIGEFDGKARWKEVAYSARMGFASTANRCEQPSDTAFEEAQRRADDLDALLRGDPTNMPVAASVTSWPQTVDRPSLMNRMERAQQQGLTVWTSNEKNFARATDKIRHEAMLLAALSEVLIQPGLESADDKQYVAHAKTLQKNALEVLAGLRNSNFEQTRAAVGNLGKSCTACHATYR